MKNYKLTFGLALGIIGLLGLNQEALAQQTTLPQEAPQIASDKEDPTDSPGPLDSEEYILEDISFYPNPAQNYLNVDFGREGGYKEVLIFDLMGNLVQRTETSESSTQISLGALKKGIYFLRIKDKTFRFQKI